VPLQNIGTQIVTPLGETRRKIEENLALLMRGAGTPQVESIHLPDDLAPLSPG
jgi:hypothetical protein